MPDEKYIPDALITGQSYHAKDDKVLEPISLLTEGEDAVDKVNQLITDHNELLRQLKNNRYIKVSE